MQWAQHVASWAEAPQVKRARKAVHARRFEFALALCLGLALAALRSSGLSEALQIYGEQRLAFALRSWVTGPGLDPRIKVFAFDDPTVAKLQAVDLSLDDWARTFKALQDAGAAGVLIDKLFDLRYSDAELQSFGALMQGVTIPIVPVSFVSATPIPHRTPVAGSRVYVDAAAVPGSDRLPVSKEARLYGATAPTLALFSATGQGNYPGDGRFAPLLRLDGDRLVPHVALALAAAATGSFDAHVAETFRDVPLTGDCRALIDFDRRDVYRKRAFSFLPLWEHARSHRPISVVGKGDLVVIIPGAYTGNTDFKETPLGIMPGGYAILAVLNSVVTGKWLRVLDAALLSSLLGALIGFLAGRRLRPALCDAVLATTALAALLGFAGAFIWLRTLLPLILPVATMIAVGAIVNAHEARKAQLESLRMRLELSTARSVQMTLIPPSRIKRDGLDIAGFYQAATECAGDFWTVLSPTPHHHYAVIGDATGHGVGPAMVSAMAYATILSHINLAASGRILPPSGEDILNIVNGLLLREDNQMTSMTMQIALIDTAKDEVTITNAAHPFPILISAAGETQKALTLPSDVLGAGAEPRLRTITLPFPLGAKIVLFSDGAYEVNNRDERPLGRSRFQAALRGAGIGSAGQLRDRLVVKVLGYADGHPLQDDVTLIVLERTAAD